MPWGSSPRMRGALYGVGDPGVGFRIIPTDAGSTAWRSAGPARPWDHPRGCGEHIGKTYSWSHWAGSSPRMRGAQESALRWASACRIIPADAGSTPPGDDADERDRDHPRGCGEHGPEEGLLAGLVGSSPRMRGALPRVGSYVCRLRIIPADAGSTKMGWISLSEEQDHPRGCGEHVADAAELTASAGSSPRMRGARFPAYIGQRFQRIIPADAGSTQAVKGSEPGTRDHPRGCGEHSRWARWHSVPKGSSPRMRGAQTDKATR